MTAPPLLTLCFPTYNRAPLLDGALRAALRQITPAHVPLLEVVVLDNASPDDTPAVVQKAQADFPNVSQRYVQRPQNIGPDANFCDAPNQALGEFVYLLSDDDILLPGAVETLLALIQQRPDLDAFALNVREFLHSPDEEGTQLALELEKDQLFPDRDQALTLLKAHITFMSCIAFRRENVLGKDYSGRSATNLAQAYMFLDALAPGRGLYATARPYLARRDNNNEGFHFFKVFITNFTDLMRHARPLGYSPQAVHKVLEHHLKLIYTFVLIFKAQGGYGKLEFGCFTYFDAIARLLRAYKFNRFALFHIVPRMLIPGFLFVRVQNFYKSLKVRRSGPAKETPPGQTARKV